MKIVSDSARRTLHIGSRIAKALTAGDIICLDGELGAGKTVLTRGIARGLGIDTGEIISPTFVLIREHRTKSRIPFYHFDLYRLTCGSDILCLGYEEYFDGKGITVIEWPDRLEGLMPKEYLKIKMSVIEEKKRRIEFVAQGIRYKKLLEAIGENIGD